MSTNDEIAPAPRTIIAGTVAIVGRPNVGKSTLFNRLIRSRRAIVDDVAGVTRDRLYGQMGCETESGEEFSCHVIDTGGFEVELDSRTGSISDSTRKGSAAGGKTSGGARPPHVDPALVWRQTEIAIEEADVIIFLLDGQAGLQHDDRVIYRHLERTDKQVIFVVNKIDGAEYANDALDFYGLGIDSYHAISAAHSRGIAELRSIVGTILAPIAKRRAAAVDDSDEVANVAIIGRPNVGKSSLLNRLSGQERAVVSDVSGTTRDSLDVTLAYNGHRYTIVDTAGLRRRPKVRKEGDRLEMFSTMRSIQAIEQADIVLLVLDATLGLSDQDARLARFAHMRHKPVAIIVNKWDAVPQKETNTSRDYAENLHRMLGGMGDIEVLFVSCLKNQRVQKIWQIIEEIHLQMTKRITTAKLNVAVREIMQHHSPTLIKSVSKRVKLFYVTQVSTKPPTIAVFCNVSSALLESYKRYLTNQLKERFGFDKVPLKLIFRDKGESTSEAAALGNDERAE